MEEDHLVLKTLVCFKVQRESKDIMSPEEYLFFLQGFILH